MVGGLPALEEARRVLLAIKRSIKLRRRTTHGGVPCDAPYIYVHMYVYTGDNAVASLCSV